MKKGIVLIRRTGIFISIAMIIFFMPNMSVQGVQTPTRSGGPDAERADIIIIDVLKSFGKLERSPVMFLHDKHTEALEQTNKDCKTCHLQTDKGRSLKFKRLKDINKKFVENNYHNECIECHKETKATGKKSGPITCGECHQEEMTVVSSRQPIGMDKSLHYRHSKAQNNKCEKCHHEYNKNTKTLFYAKDKEGTCRYCHGKVTEENRVSMRLASHISCIDCHQERLTKNQNAGPVDCSGCHDPNEQKLIKVIKNIPRMERKQPNTRFVGRLGPGDELAESEIKGWMSLVPFDHKAHEDYNNTCRVCHHADLNKCAKCHTLKGRKEGKQIKSYQAMHILDSDQSCIGCHTGSQMKPECAGCHDFIPNSRVNTEKSCKTCHLAPMESAAQLEDSPINDLKASEWLASRKEVFMNIPEKDIPDKVMIKELSDKYGPVELPHRKIVQTLAQKTKNSKLVRNFHQDTRTLCRGCHHYSPLSLNPPKCGSCHGKPFDERNPLRLGLMAAYHRQCMECHDSMEIKKPVSTDCTSCHKEK